MAVNLNDIITDGTARFLVVRLATTKDIADVRNEVNAVDTKLDNALFNNAAAHNSIYRGKDITADFDANRMSANISNGTFKNIYPGDYIVKSITVNGTTYDDIKWVVADCNYFINTGDTELTKNHVVMVSEFNVGKSVMNGTDTTADGYVGSAMWTTMMPLYSTAIVSAFGVNHVIVHDEYLTDQVTSGVTTNVSKKSVTANILNEAMVYGYAPFSSSGFDTRDGNKQFSVFRNNRRLMFSGNDKNVSYWLRSVYNSNSFAAVKSDGNSAYGPATNSYGVRIYFLLA